ncbi:putative enzyme in pimeloyl-CoA (biotin precursor) synthesis with alpha/beta-hydrolase domain [Xenorhabdus bovienii str. Jollieti]|uniref:Pimeloyl-[acyl-carrier protein] methyl ester esterase n=1 Tax=Xenorhabdus bovienii (strain SS-2004) TaxID=406818 RepID=D3UYB8_XENBS|nr:pimeloyl-ACP methyl ester esterase BioH [Xenorhabdus bovienii]CBJ79296.1 putative enzyme in pimeloyl-CoA (biotin precursor) synthesis with alpha/beta-hydrolase domain [Xenorhabdus bovienii SS-2004]CDH30023.1 putative enzyme in pimeloyl-CoA (biotin precursor) synthesis with alpha/beta-hydrolase domain [Xenorhabdus bovienii str. Jollieti]
MNKLFWQIMGEAPRDLVMLHGWGLNSEVWRSVETRLSSHFRLHLVDLPGHGRSQPYPAMTLAEMADTVWQQAPENALWLGWSLGGLVASRIALDHPAEVAGLITVASSPKFSAEGDWPGIKPTVLRAFEHQLSEDFQKTVERFLSLQTLGTDSARQDARLLKSVILNQPMPTVEVLNAGLETLRTDDLRAELAQLQLPFLRLYGYLDGLVPRKIAAQLDNEWPHTHSVIMRNAAHAPFVSHPDEFVDAVMEFVANAGL